MGSGLSAYCERTGAGLLAEPLNAVTNLAFLLAALGLWRWLRRQGYRPRESVDLHALAVLLAAIGLGSLAWHTVARPWAALADVLPIQLWISVFLMATLRRLLGFGVATTVLGLVVFQALSLGLPALLPRGWLNGSVAYLPAWATLVGLALVLAQRRSPAAAAFIPGAVLFGVSLLLRTLDRELCAAWPADTHFLWHLLNALLLYRLGTCFGPPPQSRRTAGNTAMAST